MNGYWLFIILIVIILILTSIIKTKNLLKNYISAFLNANGGNLIIGVDDNGNF